MTTPVTALQVAQRFLAMQEEDAGDLISNLKLQKLLYYAQGLHLAWKGTPLYSEQIEAWQHGPVIPDVYHAFKQYQGKPIPIEEACTASPIQDEEVKDFLNEVYDVFGQYSAWKLRNMTHEEDPYREAEMTGGIISSASMQRYFRRYLVNDGEEQAV